MNGSIGRVIVCLPLLNKMLSRFRHGINISSFSLFIAELHFILWIFQNCVSILELINIWVVSSFLLL